MGLFNRKKKVEEPKEIEITLPPHEHVWKDMPWYMITSWSGTKSTASYKIIEPYICITCGERKNVVLEEASWSNITPEAREEEYKATRKKYRRYLKPHAVVEDMINNIILVKDPERLELLEKLRGSPHRNVGTSSRYHVSKEPYEYKIKVDDPK